MSSLMGRDLATTLVVTPALLKALEPQSKSCCIATLALPHDKSDAFFICYWWD
jgi:hypothetical protein